MLCQDGQKLIENRITGKKNLKNNNSTNHHYKGKVTKRLPQTSNT